jgi:hypothetical protein
MIDVKLFSQIEEKCVCEVKKILGESAQNINVNRGSLDEKTNNASVNIAVLSGKILPAYMPDVYQMHIDICFGISSTNSQDDPSRRDEVYPILMAILWHFSGMIITLENGETVKLEPKGEFSQKHDEAPFLEYACHFTTKATIDKSEDENGEFIEGVLAKYYINPADIPEEKPNYAEEVLNEE